MMLSCWGSNTNSMDFMFCGSRNKRHIFKEPDSMTADDVITKLRHLIVQQGKRERYLTHKIDVMAKDAKTKLAQGNKRAAISLLRKRKLYEAEITKLHHIQWTLETQCFQLESAISTADAFQAMSAGTQTLQQLRTTTTVEQVDDIMMDIQEEIQIAQQVNTAIGQGIDLTTITTTTGQQILSDDDLLRELEELQQQPQQSANDLKSLKTQLDIAENGRKFNTTSRPAAAVRGSELTKREAEDFRRLQAELAM